jgi:hypothetical protein
MSAKIMINTHSYNARRYSKPWIAKVDFSTNPKGEFEWGTWIGQFNGGNGSSGTLIIDANEGDIVAKGQKDFRGNNGGTDYYQVRNGELVYLEGGKAEAYKLATAQ